MAITSQHLTGNITSSILNALYVIRHLALTTAIMNMVMMFIANIIFVRDMHKSVRGVKLQFSSSSRKNSAVGETNIGIPSAVSVLSSSTIKMD